MGNLVLLVQEAWLVLPEILGHPVRLDYLVSLASLDSRVLMVTLVSQEDQEHPDVRDFLEQRERKDIPDQTEILVQMEWLA